jgi:hypothetical protein
MFDKAEQQNSEGDAIRRFVQIILDGAGIKQPVDMHSPTTIDIEIERVFVPPLVWALFSAYRQIVTYSTAIALMMSKGLPKKVLADRTFILDAAKAALPTMAGAIDQRGIDVLQDLIEPLRDELLQKITGSLDNPDYDQRSIDRAASIVRAVEKAAASEGTAAAQPLPDLIAKGLTRSSPS